ncbi:glycosyltransferase family 4 protein [Candidatus Bathyarchaeota archaeon]|nr:glycosyltransferase family 4 protein [Candidatus Bathyarchaeota archaeon]
MILFIHKGFSTFVKRDYEILKKYFPIRCFCYKPTKGLGINLLRQIRLCIWLMANVINAKSVYVWFADYHSLLPILFARVLQKKSILVLGGYDVTCIPELGYGSFSNPLRGFCARFSMKTASICLPVSYYAEEEAKRRVKRLNSKVIYNGVEIVSSDCKVKKENIVLTAGICDGLRRIKIKGIDFFVETAKALPDYKFIVVGVSEKAEKYLGQVPKNVEIVDRSCPEKLAQFYKKAKVYCQFSLVESFGLSVAEAMLYGCVPIVTDVGALAEIVHDAGFILKERKLEKTTNLIETAMKSNLGMKARRRIVEKFSLEKRENELLAIIDKLMKDLRNDCSR